MARKYDIIKQLVSAISELPDDAQGRIFKASLAYMENGVEPQLDMVENAVFRCFKPRFDEVMEAEKMLSEKRSRCGRKGGRPKLKRHVQDIEEKANESKKSNCFSSTPARDNNISRDNNINNIQDIDINQERDKKESVGKKKAERTPMDLLEERKARFYDEIASYVDRYPREMLRSFFDYWSESNKSRTKMRYEMQPTWELSRRLSTWASRDKVDKGHGRTAESVRAPVDIALEQNAKVMSNLDEIYKDVKLEYTDTYKAQLAAKGRRKQLAK